MFSEKFRVPTNPMIAGIVLVTNAFVWYYFIIDFLQSAAKTLPLDNSTTILIWSVHFLGITTSVILGATLVNRVRERTRFLTIWMILGVASSIVSIFIDKTFLPNILILSLVFGLSLGIGMPSCMGYFAEKIQIEKRGRVAGIIMLLSAVGLVALGMVTGESTFLQTLMLLSWRVFGLVFFLLLILGEKAAGKNESIKKSRDLSYRSLLSQRSFILYLIPWIMFSLITYLTIPIQTDLMGQEAVDFLMMIENLLVAVFAIVGGFLADIVGRKRVAIFGFAMLGISYSVLGIFPKELFSRFFYTVADGVAWGMLYVVFVLTIWGDLSNSAASDKHYALGVLPFFISKFLQVIIGNGITSVIPGYAIFSFTAFFLFLAVLPLVYAPETLPEKTMKDRELTIYLAQAQKLKEKQS